MLDADTRAKALAFYAAHNCALFPIPRGSKVPTGIVASFAHDWSREPAQWSAWQSSHPGCNFGVVAGPSRIIIADVDVSEIGRERAWTLWAAWWQSRNMPVPAPHVQSARGGWHTLFSLPADVDVSSLKQIALIGPTDGSKKAVVDLRVGNGFTVAAGSFYDGTARNEQSGPYLLMTDAPPHPAPPALLEYCRRNTDRATSVGVGTHDYADIRNLVEWLVAKDAFSEYDAWVSIGMSLKVEAGDEGLEIWRITHDDTVTTDVENSKWNSFATEPGPNSVTLGTWMQRARQMGWTGSVRKSASSMFGNVVGTVAQIAANAGATLASAQAIPLADTQRIVAALGQPILDNFLAGTTDAPSRPMGASITLPDTLKEHPLFDLLNEAIERILAMAEGGSKTFRQDRVLEVIGVLDAVHQGTRENLCQRARAMGAVISPGRPEEAAYRFECSVMAEVRTAAGFAVNTKGEPDPRNSDNIHVFFRLRKVKFRHNTLTDRTEISDSDHNDYQPLTDAIFDGLMVDAENGQYNFHPSKEAFKRGIEAAARRVPLFDPLQDVVDTLATQWDGVNRLNVWLSHTCGVPNDPYHVAVGRNLIGGMVARARRPGCHHAETVIFISPEQGTGKSTLCKILALNEEWYTDSFKLGGTQQNTLPQLASKWIVELGELAGMRKTEVEEIKQFMTVNIDEYVKKYQSFPTKQPRRCVFIGTSNDKRPLADATGNRRFLPVHINGEVNLTWLRANVQQLIGEAAAREAAGESFAIPREVWGETKQHQEAARQMTPVEELCYEWFDRPPGSYFVTASDITRAFKMAGQNARYSAFLDKLGWRSDNLVVPGDGRKCRVWLRHPNNKLQDCVRLTPVQTQVNGPIEMRMSRPIAAPGGSGTGLPPLPPGFNG